MNPTDIQMLQQLLKEHAKNMITAKIDPESKVIWGRSKFGGCPDVPEGFVWPTYLCTSFDDEEACQQPLTFLAQFDCRALSAMDPAHSLPETGLLSFFYEFDTCPDGSMRDDAGSARVFWFDGSKPLFPASIPEELSPYLHLPRTALDMRCMTSYPSLDIISLQTPLKLTEALYEAYQHIDDTQILHTDFDIKLLGYPAPVFDDLFISCELLRQGFPIAEGIEFLPEQALEQAEKRASDWCLLLELHISEESLFHIGDACLAFCIRQQDLKEKRFDRIWAMLQWF